MNLSAATTASAVAIFAVIALATLALSNVIAGCIHRARHRRIAEKCEFMTTVPSHGRVPVTIVTGFLGAGKTVLLNQLLSEPGNRRICIIENEAGAVSIDHALLEANAKQADAQILVLKNGCMCCSASGPGDELERTLDRIVQLIKSQRGAFEKGVSSGAQESLVKKPFDYLVIETSGVVDPTPIIQTFFRSDIGEHFHLDGVIAVVDAKHIPTHLAQQGFFVRTREAERQIALADVVLINKADLVTDSQIADVHQLVKAVNPATEIHTCQFGKISTSLLLDRNMYDVTRWDGALINDTRQSASHSGDICTVTIGGADASMVFPLAALQDWLQQLVAVHWQNLFRLKGILKVKLADNALSAFVFHGVHEELHGDLVPLTEALVPAIILIGKQLDINAIVASFSSNFQHNIDEDKSSAFVGSTQRRRRRKSGS